MCEPSSVVYLVLLTVGTVIALGVSTVVVGFIVASIIDRYYS